MSQLVLFSFFDITMYKNPIVYKNLLSKMEAKPGYTLSGVATYPLRFTFKCMKLFFYLVLFVFGVATLALAIYISVKITSFLAPVSGIVSATVGAGTGCFSNPNFRDCVGFMFPVPAKIGNSIASLVSKSHVTDKPKFDFGNIILKEREIFLYYKSECNKTFDIVQYDQFSHNSTCCFAGPLVTESGMNWDFILFCGWGGDMQDIVDCPCYDDPPSSTTTHLPRSRRTRNKLLHSLLPDSGDAAPS